MPPSVIASRFSIFSGSRRSKKAEVVADTDDSTPMDTPSAPVIPPSAPDSSTDPAAADVDIIETVTGPGHPSIWLTDPTNARVAGKQLDVAVPTVPYEWPKAETDTIRAPNPVEQLVSRFRRKIAKKHKPEKPSASSGSPPHIQPTPALEANTDDPPPWTPPSAGLLDPDNAAANTSNPSTIPRERRYRTLGQEFCSKFTRTASASLAGLRKKNKSSADVGEGTERKPDGIQVSVTKESSGAEMVVGVEADTTETGQSEDEDTREGGTGTETREEGFDVPTITTNAAWAAITRRGILKTGEWVDPRAENACEDKPSIRFVEPLPRRPDPLPGASKRRINQRRPRGRPPARTIVNAFKTTSWLAVAVIARSKDLSEEQHRAEELHRSLVEDVHICAEEECKCVSETEEEDGKGLGASGSGGNAPRDKELQRRYQLQEMEESPVPMPPTDGLPESIRHAEEEVDIGPRVHDPSLVRNASPTVGAHPPNPIPEVTGPGHVSPPPRSFTSDNARPQLLSPTEGVATSHEVDGIQEVPRTPAPSIRSRVDSEDDEDSVPVPGTYKI